MCIKQLIISLKGGCKKNSRWGPPPSGHITWLEFWIPSPTLRSRYVGWAWNSSNPPTLLWPRVVILRLCLENCPDLAFHCQQKCFRCEDFFLCYGITYFGTQLKIVNFSRKLSYLYEFSYFHRSAFAIWNGVDQNKHIAFEGKSEYHALSPLWGSRLGFESWQASANIIQMVFAHFSTNGILPSP